MEGAAYEEFPDANLHMMSNEDVSGPGDIAQDEQEIDPLYVTDSYGRGFPDAPDFSPRAIDYIKKPVGD